MTTTALGTRGKRLWKSLLAQDATLADSLSPMREVALSACRTADRVEQLEALARKAAPLVDGRSGPSMHPVFGEVRQQEATLARLISALRLPDEASGKRPQGRSIRGVQRPSLPGGKVTSLERARARKTG